MFMSLPFELPQLYIAQFQKIMDTILQGIPKVMCYIKVTVATEEDLRNLRGHSEVGNTRYQKEVLLHARHLGYMIDAASK